MLQKDVTRKKDDRKRKQTGAQYRAKSRERQKRAREGRKAQEQRQINVWLDKASYRRLNRLQKVLGKSQGETISQALRTLERKPF
jgi:hypothetical protein